MLQTAMNTFPAWVTDTSFHVACTRFWLHHLEEMKSHRSTTSIQAVSHSGFDGHHSCCLLIGWLDSCINPQLNRPVGSVFLIKWPKTLAVSLSCQRGASGDSGDSVWLQISSNVCRNNRLRSAQAESPPCSHHASGVFQTWLSSRESSLTMPSPVSENKAVITLLLAVVHGWMATLFTQSHFSLA